MQLSKTRKPPLDPRAGELPEDVQAPSAPDETQSLPIVIANAFTRLRLRLRARVLRRLLLPVGPMALAVLGGGVFSKYAAHARWPRIYVSFDDAARITSAQVYELVRYVQQKQPRRIAAGAGGARPRRDDDGRTRGLGRGHRAAAEGESKGGALTTRRRRERRVQVRRDRRAAEPPFPFTARQR